MLNVHDRSAHVCGSWVLLCEPLNHSTTLSMYFFLNERISWPVPGTFLCSYLWRRSWFPYAWKCHLCPLPSSFHSPNLFLFRDHLWGDRHEGSCGNYAPNTGVWNYKFTCAWSPEGYYMSGKYGWKKESQHCLRVRPSNSLIPHRSDRSWNNEVLE